MDAPVSVLLPTTDGSESACDIKNQLRPGDELVVICDSESDEIYQSVENDPEIGLVVAGQPKGCSGKANAVAEGMETASNRVVAWTDDDLDHGDNWLSDLKQEFEQHGNSSELPFFVGRNTVSLLCEPIYSFAMTAAFLNNQPWGGSMIFDRSTLDEQSFLRDLRSTVGDDVLIAEYTDFRTSKSTRRVELAGSNMSQIDRVVRFVKNVRFHEPVQTAFLTAVLSVVPLAALLRPLIFSAGATSAAAVSYLFLGYRRVSFLFAPLSVLVGIPLLYYGLVKETFDWGGRTYRQESKFEVKVVD